MEITMGMSERAVRAKASVDRVTAYFASMQALTQDPDALDFTFGNPHEMALPGLTDAMRAQLEPQIGRLVRLQVQRARGAGGRRCRPQRASSDSTSNPTTSR